MRILFCVIALSLTITTNSAQAGLLGKVIKGGVLVGAGVALGKSASADSPEGKRLTKMNAYVWKALEEHDLNKANLLEYIQELEVSQDLGKVDTAAFGYALLGKKSKAIEVYEEQMIPYLPLEKESVQSQFNKAYEILKICVPKTCMGMLNGTLSLTTQKPPTEYENLQRLNKQIWNGLKSGSTYQEVYLNKLAYSGDIGMADTGAYGYAVKRYRKTALKIYEEEILPKLDSLSESTRKKYQGAYEFLKTCQFQRCVIDRVNNK